MYTISHRFFWQWLGFIYLLIVCLPSLAQLQLVPLQQRTHSVNGYRIQQDCLTLPFFDDFSKSSVKPDPLLWINQGVYINNHFAILPPSLNVATLDGINAKGRAYKSTRSDEVGIADILTSKCIDLSQMTVTDPVFISFYWQAEGLGEVPNAEDALRLQVKTDKKNWTTIWQTSGTSTQKFKLEKVPLSQTEWLHKDFQFRFCNFGKLSGQYDAWHIDYVYVYQKSKDDPIKRKDRALITRPTNILKEFTAMPVNHFLPDYQNYLRDSIYTNLINLSKEFDISSHKFQLRDRVSGRIFSASTGAIAPQRNNKTFGSVYDIFGNEVMKLFAVPDIQGLNSQADSIVFVSVFTLTGPETEKGQADFIIPTRNNDVIKDTTVIKDYFSYDDGSAEFGLGVRQQFGRLAVQFDIPHADILTGVDIYFPFWNTDLNGSNFNLIVWQSIDDKDDSKDVILFRKNFPYTAAQNLNQFTRFRLGEKGSSVEVDKKFYVGIEQITTEQPLIGFDRNTDSQQKIFFNISSSWEQNTRYKGSLMIRPVFNEKDKIIGLEDFSNDITLKYFPNPCREHLYINRSINHFMIYQGGRQIFKSQITDIQNTTPFSKIDLPKLNTGLYSLLLNTSKGNISLNAIIEE